MAGKAAASNAVMPQGGSNVRAAEALGLGFIVFSVFLTLVQLFYFATCYAMQLARLAAKGLKAEERDIIAAEQERILR